MDREDEAATDPEAATDRVALEVAMDPEAATDRAALGEATNPVVPETTVPAVRKRARAVSIQ
jgi:hypothetical protein